MGTGDGNDGGGGSDRDDGDDGSGGDDWRRLEAIGDELQRGTPLRESSLGCGRGRLEFGGRDTYLMSCGVVPVQRSKILSRVEPSICGISYS